MHQFWRFIIEQIKGRLAPPLGPAEASEITMRVMPMDLDFLMHVNNGVYFSYLDHGRMDLILRNGLFKIGRKRDWYAVVAAETIKLRRSLKLFDKFTIKTVCKGQDDKYFFILQKIFCRGELVATAIVKVRFLSKKGGTVPTSEINAEMNYVQEKVDDLSREWHNIESKYLL